LIREINLENSAVLEQGSVFIVELLETLRLPSDVAGIANPKSTTGRLDIFTRLITEPGIEFERVPRGYSGSLYLEIVPRTFRLQGNHFAGGRFLYPGIERTDTRPSNPCRRDGAI